MAEKKYLDAKQEAERLGCSIRSIQRAVADEGFPYIKFGRRCLFDPELTDLYLAERTFRGRAAEMASKAMRKAA